MNELGDLLKEHRKKKSKSIRAASEEIGISHTYLDSLEKGYDPRTKKERKPTPDVLKKIAKYYHVPYITLLRISGYFGENKDMSDDDWDALTAALTIEDGDEISIIKTNTEIALGKVFTLDPDQRLSHEDSKTVCSIMLKLAFLLYHGTEQWGTEPLMKEINEVIEKINNKE